MAFDVHMVLDIIKLILYVILFILGIKMMILSRQMKRREK